MLAAALQPAFISLEIFWKFPGGGIWCRLAAPALQSAVVIAASDQPAMVATVRASSLTPASDAVACRSVTADTPGAPGSIGSAPYGPGNNHHQSPDVAAARPALF